MLIIVKLQVNNIPGIEEVNMIKDDGTVIHFNNPKVQASLAANTFAVTGHGENKQITDLLPGILNQLGAESLTHLKKLASNVPTGNFFYRLTYFHQFTQNMKKNKKFATYVLGSLELDVSKFESLL